MLIILDIARNVMRRSLMQTLAELGEAVAARRKAPKLSQNNPPFCRTVSLVQSCLAWNRGWS